VLCSPSSVRAAEGGGEDTIAKPLSTTVARLAEKPGLSAKDCSEMAQTTITYGQRVKSTQQHPPENVIRDALQAVDVGEKLDAKAADWPKLRSDLEELLKKEEPPPQDKKYQDKQKQDQQKKDQPQQDQQQQNQDQQKSDEQKQQDQQQQEQQQQKQNQDAFGDMKDQQDQKKDQPAEPKPQPPKPGTQKVGGQQDKQPEEQNQDPELAMPLQKLEQVRNQDSPAKLQQIMQGQQQKPKTPGKDW